MVTAIPTLHFGGRCEEAIALYQRAFGLTIDWLGRDEKTNRIYHTEARIGEQRVRLSDGGRPDIQSDSVFLALVFDTSAEVRKAFDALADGGTVAQYPHRTEFAECMSELKDKFGVKWFLMT